ncbi:Alpha/Beta hydrolase protein [Coniochaeta sp. 2T2.1]|nr:Alpha/Beta hydrolase protein [Coniochaeta sp. 2T2.1]
MASAGYKPNNGLHDQRLGLLWIQHHIAGFCGDPQRVTFIGESSGAASGCFHLHSTDALFSQLISMSGTSLIKAKQPEAAERSFKTAMQLFSSSEPGTVPSSNEAQVRRLLTAPMDEIRDKIGRKVPLGPLVDGGLIPRATSYALMADDAEAAKLFPGMQWCRRIMIGDCQMDGNAYAPRLASRSDILPKTLTAHLAAALDSVDPSLTQAIISGYNLPTAATANTFESTKPVLDLATDICWSVGARSFARSWSSSTITNEKKAFLYRFNVPNPWDGAWKGHATHILDIAFVLQNYREYLAPGQQKAGELFGRHVIAFVNGDVPWPAYGDGGRPGAYVYFAPEEGEEDASCYVEDEAHERTGRRGLLQGVRPEVLDRVMGAWEMCMKGPK